MGDGVKFIRCKVPIHDVPPRGDVIRPLVLVLQVVGVLPDVEAEERCAAVNSTACPDWVWIRFSIPAVEDEPGPAAAEYVRARPGEVVLERGEAAEVGIDGFGQLPVGSPPPACFIICQNSEWLKCPPPLLRTAVRIFSGTVFRS